MSILLESLVESHGQPDASKDVGIPNVSDSHFDDEMLGDEWLLARVRFWKLLTISLALILLLVLLSAFLLWPKARLDGHQPNNVSVVVNKIEEEKSTDAPQTKYQPKIIEPMKIVKSTSDVNATSVSATSRSSEPKAQPILKPVGQASSGTPIIYESLSEEEKQKIPVLKINSYAVSSNPSKSFVVLNDAFYGQGETIAPHLVLVLIDDKGIVVKYNGRLIRKKYDL